MIDFEICLLLLTFVGLAIGSTAIWLVRVSRKHEFAIAGHFLFIATLVFLGITTFVAAARWADGVVPLGLVSGFLATGMLWETPKTTMDEARLLNMSENA